MSEKFQKKFINEEYENQHFGFSSYDFISQFQNIFHLRVDESLEELEKAIADKLKLDSDGKNKLHKEVLSGADLTKTKINDTFESREFQEKIRAFINIPDNIVLPDDVLHLEDFGNDSVEALTKEIEQIEKYYKKEKLLNAIYEQELNINRNLVPLEEHHKAIYDQVNNWQKLSQLKRVYDKANTKINYVQDVRKTFDENSDSNNVFVPENYDPNDVCVV